MLYFCLNMTSKSAKQSKKGAKTDSVNEAASKLNMVAMAKLLEKHRQALSAEFKIAISTLEEKTDSIQTTLCVFTHVKKKMESANDLDEWVTSVRSDMRHTG